MIGMPGVPDDTFKDARVLPPDIIVRRDFLRLYPAAFLVIKPADETNLSQELLGAVGCKIKYGILLAYLRGDHGETWLEIARPLTLNAGTLM